jgi:hypothetical protein
MSRATKCSTPLTSAGDLETPDVSLDQPGIDCVQCLITLHWVSCFCASLMSAVGLTAAQGIIHITVSQNLV